MASQAYDAFLATRKAAGLSRNNCAVAVCTTESSCFSSTAWVTNPITAASLPVMERPVRIISAALFWPTSAARAVQATGGKHASRISGNPHSASSMLYTRSQTMATSAPPPRQSPWTDAIVTLVVATSARMTAWNFASISSTLSGVCAATSTPAENALPAPLRTITEMSLRASSSARDRANSSIIAMSITFSGGLRSSMRATAPSISHEVRERLASVREVVIVLGQRLYVDRGFSHFADRRERIASSGLLGNPLLLGPDDLEQQFLIDRRGHVLLQMLLVGAIIQQLAGLGVKLLSRAFTYGTIEFDIGRIELGLARLQISIKALDQSSHLVAIEVAVVVVQVVEIWSLVVLGFVVPALHAPNVSPVRRRGMIGAEEIVRTGNPLIQILLDQPRRNDLSFHDAPQTVVAGAHVECFFAQHVRHGATQGRERGILQHLQLKLAITVHEIGVGEKIHPVVDVNVESAQQAL